MMQLIKAGWRYALGMIGLLFCSLIYGQDNFQIKHLGTEDGLSQGMIYCMLQDSDGFIWIGTKDGLNRYDGKTFKVFTNDPEDPTSISGNTVTLLYEDSHGYIWAASQNSGLNIYDKRTGIFHHIEHDPQETDGISGNDITAILEGSHGNFILSIAKVELNVFSLDDAFFKTGTPPKVKRIRLPTQQHRLQNEMVDVRGLYKDEDENIWVVGDQFTYQFEVDNMHLQESALSDSSFYQFYGQTDGTWWAFKKAGQLYYGNGKDTVRVADFGLPPNNLIIDNNTVYTVYNDSLRYFEFNSDTKLVSNFRSIGFGDEHPPSSMIKDRSGQLWIGTKGHGIYVLNLKSERFNHIAKGTSVADITLFKGELALKTYVPSWEYPGGAFLPLPDHIRDRHIANILPLSDDEVFYKYLIFGPNQIVYEKIINGKEIAFSFHSSFSDDFFDPVIQTRDGNIIAAGANNQLAVIDEKSGDYVIYDLDFEILINAEEYQEQKPSGAIITCLYEDAERILWVGTNQGFMTVDRNSDAPKLMITRYQNKQLNPTSLSYDHVTCFMPDPLAPEKFMWVTTKGGGLNKMNMETGEFTRYSTDKGLPDKVVYGVLADEKGNIWGSTNKGVFCMIPEENSNYTVRSFSKADGLQEEEFNTNAFLKLPDGRLAFGGVNGVNVFDPEQVLQEGYKPPVYITDIVVNNQAISSFDSTGLMNQSPEYTTQLTLRPGQNILSIRYASLDFRGSNKIQYRYQMKGLSEDWNKVGNQQSASFINLSPGDYVFSVQGTNSQGVWSDDIAELKINVLPPWWKTWWAYLLYLAVAVVVTGLIFRFYLKRSKLQQQLVFEKQEAERVRELDALKTQLFTNMTHEFRTPLTVIIGMAQQVLDQPKQHFKSRMNMIINNGRSLLGLVNKMLDLAKLESGKMTLDLVQDDIVSFLRTMVESFRSFAAKKEIQLHFLAEIDQLVMDFDPDKLQQVISNLISNAFKFTPDGGNIYFSLRQEEDRLKIRIKDTGRGIPEEDQSKIFDRFYQVESSSSRRYEGTGIGLALSKDLITLMEGRITVQSPPVGARQGSEFSITLPIQREAMIIATKSPANTKNDKRPATGAELTLKNVAQSTPPIAQISVPLINEEEKPMILLVEDNADVVAYIASCLEDYRLTVAVNGKEGLKMAGELIPDLVISDVMMPIMDGLEFTQKLKSNELTAHIPVIILTARADMDSKLEGLGLGANAYLPKPFDKQELLLNIKNLFKLRNKLQQRYQTAGGLKAPAEKLNGNAVLPKSEDAFVEKVSALIEAHIADLHFTVEQLAKELHLSHSQLGRKLDALTGFTPNRFIRNIRLKKAKELLLDPEQSITAIAYDCGFNDPSYFTRVFKKEFGKTPVEWRSATAHQTGQ